MIDWSVSPEIEARLPRNGQIPLCRLPRDVRDEPVTSPLAQIPLRRLPRNFPARGSFGEVGVMEFGLKEALRFAIIMSQSDMWSDACSVIKCV